MPQTRLDHQPTWECFVSEEGYRVRCITRVRDQNFFVSIDIPDMPIADAAAGWLQLYPRYLRSLERMVTRWVLYGDLPRA